MIDSSIKERIYEDYSIFVVSEAIKYNTNWLNDKKIPEEYQQSFKCIERKFLPLTLRYYNTKSDIDNLKALIEDKSCLKRETNVEEWLGFWLLLLWNFIPSLHLEHQKLKPASGGGPAPGLRSFLPPPKVPKPLFTEIPNITNNLYIQVDLDMNDLLYS